MTTHDDTEQLDDNLDAEIDALGDDPNALRRLLRGKVAKRAVRALTGVCSDPRAPAPAKATAGSALLRAGGFFEKIDVADDHVANDSLEELEKKLAVLKETIAAMDAAEARGIDVKPSPVPKKEKPGGGLFD
jgi:hypothetical protein